MSRCTLLPRTICNAEVIGSRAPVVLQNRQLYSEFQIIHKNSNRKLQGWTTIMSFVCAEVELKIQ